MQDEQNHTSTDDEHLMIPVITFEELYCRVSTKLSLVAGHLPLLDDLTLSKTPASPKTQQKT